MILLNQNSINNVYLTLSESITLTATPVYFLFRFIDETTFDDLLFTAPDISTNTLRYNQFQIITTGLTYQNLTAGTITMNPQDKWRYEVYEQLSQTNLFLSGTSGTIIENGIVTLSGTSLSIITNSYTGASTTYNYYTP